MVFPFVAGVFALEFAEEAVPALSGSGQFGCAGDHWKVTTPACSASPAKSATTIRGPGPKTPLARISAICWATVLRA
jgi:hypothetical protein